MGIERPTSARVWLGRCPYLHGSVGKRQGQSSRRADGDYLMVSVDRVLSIRRRRRLSEQSNAGLALGQQAVSLVSGCLPATRRSLCSRRR